MADMSPGFEPDIPPAMLPPEGADAPRVVFGLPLNVVIIVGAIVGLLVVGGLVVGLVLLNIGRNAAEQAAVSNLNNTLNAAATPAATRTVETTESEGNRLVLPVTNSDVFTSRDPFRPVLKPLPEVVVATASAVTTGSPEYNTLILENIVSSNGVLTAILKWNGVTYTAVAGQQLDASPWKVLAITKTTATMLYGDVQVTLSIGEGVAQ